EQRLDLALSGSGFGLWDWDVPTGRIFADDRWFTMLGFAPHEFPLDVDTWIALVHPDDRGRVSAALDAHFAGESPHYECEIRIRTREGGWRWVLDRGRVVERDPEGHPLRATGTHTDIQDRKQAEEALRRSEERLATIVRAAPLGITLTRAVDGVFMEVNETFAEVLGYDREALLGASAIDLGIWQKTSEREAAIAVLREEGRLAGRPVQFRTRDGELRTFLLFSELLEVEGLPCALTLHQDVTEARQLEAQLIQAQKMEAVGRLAGGIAHDFNNLLTAITGHVEFLLDALPEGDPRRDDAGGIRDSADRAKRLTRQLLAFSRQQVLNPRVVDLAEVVVSFEPLLSRIIGEDVALSVSRPEGRCPVRVDPGQLEQVVLNLVVNARDAMPDGGSLVIAADSIARRDQPTEGFRRPVPTGAYARLRVSDSGSGMDAATRDHIFEPFFTTKPAGKGTGLGLSTVYGIVSQSGGHVGVESGLDRGTTFTLLFPLVEESSAPADPAPRALPPREPDDTRSGSVLVVEDEDAVRLLARRVLDRAGYRVRAAPSGAEALRLADRAGPFDLVLTDMVMPGMSGRELVDHLRGDGRRLRVLYMSGYTADEVVRDGQNRNGSFLEKPFTPAELVRAVQEALGTSAS
ncbi:MAG: PAS domain-containing protein, partial [Gemmatimonadota bacterium]